MIFTSATEMIQAALESIGVVDPEEPLDPGKGSSGLRTLNLLLDEYSLDRGKVFIRTEDTFALVVGTGTYLIGVGQTWNTILPVMVEQVFLRDSGTGQDIPIRVNMTQAERNSDPLKSTQNVPTALYFSGGIDPGSIIFDYLPNKAYELHLFSHKPFAKLTEISTQLVVPDGYESAITNALAIRLCAIHQVQVPAVVANVAAKMEKMIDNRNLELPPTWQDITQPRTMNWGRGGGSGYFGNESNP